MGAGLQKSSEALSSSAAVPSRPFRTNSAPTARRAASFSGTALSETAVFVASSPLLPDDDCPTPLLLSRHASGHVGDCASEGAVPPPLPPPLSGLSRRDCYTSSALYSSTSRTATECTQAFNESATALSPQSMSPQQSLSREELSYVAKPPTEYTAGNPVKQMPPRSSPTAGGSGAVMAPSRAILRIPEPVHTSDRLEPRGDSSPFSLSSDDDDDEVEGLPLFPSLTSPPPQLPSGMYVWPFSNQATAFAGPNHTTTNNSTARSHLSSHPPSALSSTTAPTTALPTEMERIYPRSDRSTPLPMIRPGVGGGGSSGPQMPPAKPMTAFSASPSARGEAKTPVCHSTTTNRSREHLSSKAALPPPPSPLRGQYSADLPRVTPRKGHSTATATVVSTVASPPHAVTAPSAPLHQARGTRRSSVTSSSASSSDVTPMATATPARVSPSPAPAPASINAKALFNCSFDARALQGSNPVEVLLRRSSMATTVVNTSSNASVETSVLPSSRLSSPQTDTPTTATEAGGAGGRNGGVSTAGRTPNSHCPSFPGSAPAGESPAEQFVQYVTQHVEEVQQSRRAVTWFRGARKAVVRKGRLMARRISFMRYELHESDSSAVVSGVYSTQPSVCGREDSPAPSAATPGASIGSPLTSPTDGLDGAMGGLVTALPSSVSGPPTREETPRLALSYRSSTECSDVIRTSSILVKTTSGSNLETMTHSFPLLAIANAAANAALERQSPTTTLPTANHSGTSAATPCVNVLVPSAAELKISSSGVMRMSTPGSSSGGVTNSTTTLTTLTGTTTNVLGAAAGCSSATFTEGDPFVPSASVSPRLPLTGRRPRSNSASLSSTGSSTSQRSQSPWETTSSPSSLSEPGRAAVASPSRDGTGTGCALTLLALLESSGDRRSIIAEHVPHQHQLAKRALEDNALFLQTRRLLMTHDDDDN